MTETERDIETLSEKHIQGQMAAKAPAGVSGAQVPRKLTYGETAPEPPKFEILYGASLHPLLRTLKPFSVNFEQSEGNVAAVIGDLNEYGLGANRSEALEDLRRTLAELYFTLEAERARLSGDLERLWVCLHSHVNRIRA